MQRKRFMALLAAALLLATLAPARADTWPSRPITMVVPFPPGGTLDVVARLLAHQLGQQLGQTVIVANRAGGAGIIGATVVAQSPPDGYTLLFSASTFTTTPMTQKVVQYDVWKSFTPIALVAKAPLAIAVNEKLPFNDVKGLLDYGRAHPGKLSFAIGSTGSAGHLATELLLRPQKIEHLIVPYKGSSPAYEDLIGGRIDAFIDPVLGSASFAKSGRLKVVAVTSKARIPDQPTVPTVGETVPGYEFYSWYGLWGPAHLPPAVAARLNAEVDKALAGEMRAPLTEQGLLLTPGSIEDFVRFQKEDMARSQRIVDEAHIHVE